jgi:uncharacterized membrane protein
MTTHPISSKDKKLRNLRKILWIVFAAIAITIVLIFCVTIPVAYLVNIPTNFMAIFNNETGMLLLSLVALMLAKIAVTGVICVVIYHIVKYRLEKDDELFL